MKILFKNLCLLSCILMFSCQSTSTTSTTSNTPTSPDYPPVSTRKGIDTARDVDYMTTREKDMIKEINLIRSNPKGYIPIVEAYIKEQKESLKNIVSGKKYVYDEIETAEELIKVLRNTDPISILEPHEGVYKAAKLHGQEGKRRGKLNHDSKNGDWPWDRIEKYAGLSNGGENLVGGPDDVRESVILLLVDSGIKNRGHRETLLKPEWKYVACYEVGTVGDMPNYWVQNFGF